LLYLSLQVKIGNEPYHCSCVSYASPDDPTIIIIIGVVIAVILLILIIIIIIIIIIFIVRRRRQQKKKTKETPEQGVSGYGGGTPIAAVDNQYTRQLPDEYREVQDLSEGDGQYSRTLPDYSDSAGQDSTQYSRQLPDD